MAGKDGFTRKERSTQQLQIDALKGKVQDLQNPGQKKRFDIAVSISITVAVVIFVVGYFIPPATRPGALFWLATVVVAGAYPVLHLSENLLRHRARWVAYILGMTIWIAGAVVIGSIIWHPHRHKLSRHERDTFIAALNTREGPPDTIQIICPSGDETTCSYAFQFVDLFGAAGWPVADGSVRRGKMRMPYAGVTFLAPQIGPPMRPPGKWYDVATTLVSDSAVTARRAFVAIDVQPDIISDSTYKPGELVIYSGTEKEDPTEETIFGRSMDKYEKEHPRQQ